MLALVLACSPSDPEPTCEPGGGHLCDVESGIAAEVGFIDLDEEAYRLRDVQLTSSPARLFYSFHPSSSGSDAAPLFVLNAGGPGAACMYMIAHGSGPYRIQTDEGAGVEVTANPHSLTALANLLYLDARNTGFSYPVLDNPGDQNERLNHFTGANYNVYRDAADLLRALLAFLRNHPDIAANPIYFVAESYGGMRTTVMLNLLLFHGRQSDDDRQSEDALLLRAPELTADLDEYSAVRFGSTAPEPGTVAEQFRGQILVQPWLAGIRQLEVTASLLEQPDSPLDEIAAETGVPYLRCSEQPAPCDAYVNAQEYLRSANRSAYDFRQPDDWLEQYDAPVSEAANQYELLRRLLDVEDEQLLEAFRGPRPGAFRYGDLAYAPDGPAGDLQQHLDALEPWDGYFVATNNEARTAFFDGENRDLDVEPNQARYGELFLQNLRYIDTLVTRAAFDLVVYSPALAPTLESYPEVDRATVADGPGGEEIRIAYADGDTRTFAAPRYPQSSHAVFLDEPAALLEDIAAFLGL